MVIYLLIFRGSPRENPADTMKTMNIKCPKCERLVPFIPFGYGQVAVCCGKVLASLSNAEAQVAEYLTRAETQVEEYLTGPDASGMVDDAAIQ